MRNIVLALCGALVGGVLGYIAFFWLAAQGFYGLALPGVDCPLLFVAQGDFAHAGLGVKARALCHRTTRLVKRSPAGRGTWGT